MSDATVLSVDVMGGDLGPRPIIAGLVRAARNDPSLRFLLHGDEAAVGRLLARRRILNGRYTLRHSPRVVPMDEKPSRAVRRGRDSSLWSSLQAVQAGEARVAFSAGNTGAIVAMATLVLRRAPGVQRPAIAVHWPARTAKRYNVALDMGADIRADAATLVQYAVMGAEYARVAFRLEAPRVGLLNIGSEDTKGHPDLHSARSRLEAMVADERPGFSFVGFVEGNDIPGDRADVIVTDGFTGNIAMKASEGTAKLIREALKEAFRHSVLSRIGGLFALTSLQRLRRRIDPRRVNGGVFLGLNGGVVKSHGSADAIGHESAILLAARMARQDFPSQVARQLAKFDVGGLCGAPSAADEAKNR